MVFLVRANGNRQDAHDARCDAVLCLSFCQIDTFFGDGASECFFLCFVLPLFFFYCIMSFSLTCTAVTKVRPQIPASSRARSRISTRFWNAIHACKYANVSGVYLLYAYNV